MALIGAVYFLPDGSSSLGFSKLNQYERMQIHTSECLPRSAEFDTKLSATDNTSSEDLK